MNNATTTTTLGKTSCGYKIHAFELKDQQPFAIWLSWGHDDVHACHMTQLHDGSIAIEWSDEYHEYLSGEYFGPDSLATKHKHPTGKYIPRRLNAKAADPWLKLLRTKAWVTENSVIYDSVTEGYYIDSDLPLYVFWSDWVGDWVGPGSDLGANLKEDLNVKNELWPLLEEMGVPSAKALKECLLAGSQRTISANEVMIAKCDINTRLESFDEAWSSSFRYWGDPINEQCSAGINWLNSLNGAYPCKLSVAEKQTATAIDLWLKTKAPAGDDTND